MQGRIRVHRISRHYKKTDTGRENEHLRITSYEANPLTPTIPIANINTYDRGQLAETKSSYVLGESFSLSLIHI